MSVFAPERSRAPGGLLYPAPYELPQFLPLASNWNYRLSAEVGAVHGGDGAPRLREYGDSRNGVFVNHFDFGLEQAGTPHYLDATGGAVGRKDQSYRVSFGRLGDFRASIFFSELPKNFTDQARTVFLGAGGGSLTLPAGLAPGAGTAAQIAAALQAANAFELGFVRRNAGMEFETTPGSEWRLHARYSQDRKNGTRPIGGASNYPGAPLVEAIEPIDYKTHNVSAGLQWAGETQQVNVSYAASFFRNGVDTLTWENPLNVGDPAVLQRTRLDLYPDNDSHNLKLDWGAALPMRGRLSGGLSWTRMTQDDDLVAPTVNSGITGGVDLANWNTTAALSQKSAGARIDTRLAHLTGSFAPLRDLTLQARLRRFDEDNKTRYTAFNPLTGEYGYLGLDGANNSNIVPGNFLRMPVQSVPYGQRKDNVGLEGDYRLLRRTSVTLGYEREDIRDSRRAAAETREGRVRAALSNRDIQWATVRVSYEHARRKGDAYNYNPNAAYYSDPAAALVPAPATLADLRQSDVADRVQQVARARVNFLVARDMDFAVSGKVLDNDYGAEYGLLAERIAALNLEWSWQARPGATAYAFYGIERKRSRMASISDNLGGSTDPNAGGLVYPLANRWEEESRDDAHTAGLGFRYAFARATLESGYAYHYAPYRVQYSYASDGALVPGVTSPTAGAGMPDTIFRQQSLETSLKIRLDRHSALRLYHRYERTRIEDWHYTGMPLVLGFGEAVFLGAGPASYSTHQFGVFFQYTPGRSAGKSAGNSGK